MPPQGSPVVTDALATADAGQGRSFAARHGAALAAGATALVLLAIAAALVPRRPLEAPPAPPAHWFDDRAGLVSPGYAGAKSEYLQQYLPLVLHVSVLIVTEPTTPSGAIEDYTSRAANAWRIGAKGADNGVVLFVFRDPRTVRLEVGYGLEGPLPDVEGKHLVEATLLPKFAAGQYEEGFDDFIFGLQEKLKVYSGETDRTPNATGIVEYVFAVLRQIPRGARSAWALFQDADATGRVVLRRACAVRCRPCVTARVRARRLRGGSPRADPVAVADRHRQRAARAEPRPPGGRIRTDGVHAPSSTVAGRDRDRTQTDHDRLGADVRRGTRRRCRLLRYGHRGLHRRTRSVQRRRHHDRLARALSRRPTGYRIAVD
ncbi:MAG: TPM domain-containing protein, partial [Betaproteobacteria bacterium]